MKRQSTTPSLLCALLLLALGSVAQADMFYVSSAGDDVIELYNSGGQDSVFANSASSPEGLAFDSCGNLYVANFNGSTIIKFDSRGNGTVFASSGLNQPIGIAFDGSGNLYVANFGDNTIEKFDSAGNPSQFSRDPGSIR